MRFIAGVSLLLLPALAAAQNGTKLFSYADAFSSKFSPSRTSLTWVSADADGTYIEQQSNGNLVFNNIVTNQSSVFFDATATGLDYYDYFIQPSRDNILFATDYKKQYRHSYFANYHVYNRESGKLTPLIPDQRGDIQYAAWSSTGDVIAFVRGNDLYIWKSGEVTRITNDGGPDVFNAVPDWVYEEEIFGDRFTLWFSPDGEYLAYLRFNETGVPTFRVPYYLNNTNYAPPYPHELELRYPKVSQTNPTVSFQLLNVNSTKVNTIPVTTFERLDLVVSEVAWVAEKHEHVIFRTMNRVQDKEKLVLVDVDSGSTKVVRERDGTDGWLDNNLAIQYVEGGEYYLDLSDHTGWTHLYLYPIQGGEPKALTSGKWEVSSIAKIDSARDLVYYFSTQRHSTERHLYSVNIKTGKKTALVDDKKEGYWGASFSAGGSYYILSYNGPELPWQQLRSINSTSPLRTLNDNAALKASLAEYKLPTVKYLTLEHPNGYKLNAREILPANFSPRKKYPVLFDPYGGPGSQTVSKSWATPGWRTYIGSDPELEYIVLTVDNRGTGYQGRAFRSLVTGKLGVLESEDQVWAAQLYARKSYVDKDHITMWGWSYGGYLTAKTIEQDSGAFSLGLITAPVSDWRFYDSLYTERYMKTLELNPEGYKVSAVTKTAGFKNAAGGVLVQHGTGDDNVHYQHTAVLLDTLVRDGVTPLKLDAFPFTDSDHSIRFHNANAFLYKQLTQRLYEEKKRAGQEQKHQWSRRAMVGKLGVRGRIVPSL